MYIYKTLHICMHQECKQQRVVIQPNGPEHRQDATCGGSAAILLRNSAYCLRVLRAQLSSLCSRRGRDRAHTPPQSHPKDTHTRAAQRAAHHTKHNAKGGAHPAVWGVPHGLRAFSAPSSEMATRHRRQALPRAHLRGPRGAVHLAPRVHGGPRAHRIPNPSRSACGNVAACARHGHGGSNHSAWRCRLTGMGMGMGRGPSAPRRPSTPAE